MRRSVVFVVVAVVGLLLASATPASSAAAEKTTHLGIECFIADFTTAEFSEAGVTLHIRGGVGSADEYIWDGDSWEEAGENSTVINANENLKNGTATSWGTFEIVLDGFGTFAGSWANGVANGKATDDSGMLLKVDLDPDVGEWPEDAAAMGNWPVCPTDPDPEDPIFYLPPLPVEYTVINPQT